MIWDCFSASRVRDLVKTDAITELRNLEKHLIGLIFHPKCNAIKAYLDLKKTHCRIISVMAQTSTFLIT